jgi:hypothetical protein
MDEAKRTYRNVKTDVKKTARGIDGPGRKRRGRGRQGPGQPGRRCPQGWPRAGGPPGRPDHDARAANVKPRRGGPGARRRLNGLTGY